MISSPALPANIGTRVTCRLTITSNSPRQIGCRARNCRTPNRGRPSSASRPDPDRHRSRALHRPSGRGYQTASSRTEPLRSAQAIKLSPNRTARLCRTLATNFNRPLVYPAGGIAGQRAYRPCRSRLISLQFACCRPIFARSFMLVRRAS
jgi:hypothetical protein